MCCSNCAATCLRSALLSEPASRIRIPAASRAGESSSWKSLPWREVSDSTRLRIARSCSVGGAPSHRRRAHGGLDLLLEAGDPDLEELVQALAEDGQEVDAVEQR